MRGSLLLIVLSAVFCGCMNQAVNLADVSTWSRMKPRIPDVTPDTVEIHYIFLERKQGDVALNETIWSEADEQAINLDLKTTLNKNGLRIAKLGKNLPPQILKMLESSNSKGEGRRHRTHAGGLVKVQVTGILPKWNVFIVSDGAPSGEELDNAQGYLFVRTTVAEGNSVQLSMTPEVEYGPFRQKRVPAADLSDWSYRSGRESRSFTDLKMDLDVEAGEYLLIGCIADRKGTLGYNYFTKTVDGVEMQSVLLIRVLRPSRAELYSAGYDFDDFFLTPIRRTVAARRSSVSETVLASKRREQYLR